jgi:hypothetical protein
MSQESIGMRVMRKEMENERRMTTDKKRRIINMNQSIEVIEDLGMIESIGKSLQINLSYWIFWKDSIFYIQGGLKMTNELTQVVGKNEEVQIKKKKQEVPAIMKMKVEAQKAMIKILGNTNLKKAQDNQNNEVQSKTVVYQTQNQDGIKGEIPMMKIPLP